jgi:hypothetical protein
MHSRNAAGILYTFTDHHESSLVRSHWFCLSMVTAMDLEVLFTTIVAASLKEYRNSSYLPPCFYTLFGVPRYSLLLLFHPCTPRVTYSPCWTLIRTLAL